MIDTDKYERTTPELEEFEGENLGDLLTNLLAEVKRLREGIAEVATNMRAADPYMDSFTDDLMELIE